jgi:rhamnulokinase
MTLPGAVTAGARLHVAVDLGAGSGRVFVGGADAGRLRAAEAHRFHYAPRRIDGHLRWDARALEDGLRAGLRRAWDVAAS